jgi:histone-lysine N-methyltransferase SETD2
LTYWNWSYVQEAFQRLPLPYIDQEFSIDPINKQDLETESEPPPYVHIKDSILC